MAINDVLKVQGDYRIITVQGGNLTIDVSGNSTNSKTLTNPGTVTIYGNLDVVGKTTQIESTNVNIQDRVLTLNSGDSGSFSGAITGSTSDRFSGIKIARGYGNPGSSTLDNDNIAAFIQWNDNTYWRGTGQASRVNGLFEFRVGLSGGSNQYSGIKINAIRIDKTSASTITGYGNPRLNIFGIDNPDAVMSVKGTTEYWRNVVDPDDIPNVEWVKNWVSNNGNVAPGIRVGKSYLTLFDAYNTPGAESEAILVLNASADPSTINLTTNPPTDGTVAMKITETVAEFNGIRLVGNMITPVGLNSDLILATNTSTSNIIFASPTYFENTVVPTPNPGQVSFYVAEPAAGGTGLFFVTSSTGGTVTNAEVITRKKALIYALIF